MDAAGDSAEQLWEKLLESAGAGAGAARDGQKVLDSAGELSSAAVWAGTIARGYCSYAGTIAPDESRSCQTAHDQVGLEQSRALGL